MDDTLSKGMKPVTNDIQEKPNEKLRQVDRDHVEIANNGIEAKYFKKYADKLNAAN